MANQDRAWVAAQKEAKAFVESFHSADLEGSGNVRNKAIVEIARQLILLNGSIETLTEAVHRNADNK